LTDSLLLIQGSDDVRELNNSSLLNSKVICFDFVSHRLLNKKSISHQIIDNYFKTEDKIEIDEKTIATTQNWYKQSNSNQMLEFNELNIGQLIEPIALQYFLETFWKLFGIQRVIEKENPKKILSNSLYPYCKILDNERTIELIRLEENTKSSDIEKIELSFNLGGKMISTKISRNRYSKMKEISEKILSSFLRINSQINRNEEFVLLLDFNPVYFPELLRELSRTFPQVCLLNQRRPAIWNKESYNIIKKTNCKIIQLSNFSNNQLNSKIEKNQEEFVEKVVSGLKKIDKKYFSIFNSNYWEIFKTEFIPIIENRGKDLIKQYFLLEKLFENISPNCIFEWSHKGFEEQIVNKFAYERKIPVVFLQHAQFVQSKNYDKYLTIHPVIPEANSKEAIWGNIGMDYLIEKKVEPDQILLTGSPRHDSFFNQIDQTTNDGTVLIATSGVSNLYTFAGNEIKTLDKFEESLRKTIKIIKKFPDKKPIVKLHPAQSKFDIKALIHEIDPSIPIYKDTNVINLLKKCDTVISTDYSTILLEAMIFKKPSMCISMQKLGHEEEPMIKNLATYFVPNLEKLDDAISRILSDEEFRKEIVENGNKHVENYFENKGNSSKYLTDVLKNIR